MRRRTLLGSAAASLAGATGCLGRPGDGEEETTARADDSGNERTPTTEGSGADTQSGIDPTLVAVHRGLVRMTYPDAIGLVEETTRYVVVAESESAVESPPARDEFTLHFDGEEYAPLATDPEHEYYRLGPFYTPDSPGGQLLFALPTSGDAADATLRWPDGEMALPGSARERLAAAPDFSVTVEGPETGPTFTLSVTNEGDHAQRFLAAVNLSGPTYAPAGTPTAVVEGGETERLTVSIPGTYAAELTDRPEGETPSGRVTFDWVGGEAEREFPVE